MGHLSTFMWIKVHYIDNTFTCLKFSKFTSFNPNNTISKNFEKVEISKPQAGMEPVIYRFVVSPLTHCATLLLYNFEEQLFINYIRFSLVFFDKQYVTPWRCPVLLNTKVLFLFFYQKVLALTSCKESVKTVRYVERCPIDLKSWEKAAKNMKCEAMKHNCLHTLFSKGQHRI